MDLSHNPGLLAIAAGKSFKKMGEHRIYHVINLELYEPTMMKLKSIIEGIGKIGNFSELNGILYTKFNNLNNLYNGLQMKKRQKRGLLNFVGSGIKFITGNLDNEDFVQITRDMEDLRMKNNQFVNENNEQIKINYQMQDRINKMIHQINNQQSLIIRNFNLARGENSLGKQIQTVKEIINVNIIIDNLVSHFKDISESIHLAKLNIISKHILHQDELSFSIEKLEEKGIEIYNIEQVYDFLEISAFFNSSKLIFIVKVPSIENVTYNNLILEPLPVGNKILNLPSNKAITSNTETYFITKECQRIEQNNICSEDILLNYSEDSCYSNLLRGFTGNCTFKRYDHSKEIKRLTDSHVVIKSKLHLEIKTDCGITNRNLSGLFLIEYHNCSIEINSTTYQNTAISKNELPIILPFDGLRIEEQITEDQAIADLHIINRHHLDTLMTNHNVHHYSSISLSILSVSGVIVVTVVYCLRSRGINIKILGSLQPAELPVEHTTEREETVTKLKEAKPEMSNRDVSTSPKGVIMHGQLSSSSASKPIWPYAGTSSARTESCGVSK